MEDTKEHIMIAAKELLLAAGGALRFCRAYVETQMPKSSQPELLTFFQKAIFSAWDICLIRLPSLS